MQELNLIKFYNIGKELKDLNTLVTGEPVFDSLMKLANVETRLTEFWNETLELQIPKTREAVKLLMRQVGGTQRRFIEAIKTKSEDATLTLAENTAIKSALSGFEREFEHESQELGVFGVTPKGDRSVRILLEDAAQKFPQNLLAVMPSDTINDLRQAGRCLAFELPTACAFHICRATEALMLAYYETLTGNAWASSRRDWHTYNSHLATLGAPSTITNRLNEIRENRNSYAHPDITVPIDEASVIYELCSGVIFYMAKEIERLQANAAALGSSVPVSTP